VWIVSMLKLCYNGVSFIGEGNNTVKDCQNEGVANTMKNHRVCS